MRTSFLGNGRTSSTAQPFPLDALALDHAVALPLHRQLYDQLRALILRRTLAPLTALPSTRAMAVDLGVARNTVITAYEQLAAEGYLTASQGARACVADLPRQPVPMRTTHPADPLAGLSERGRAMVDQPRQASFPGHAAFHPGTPDIQHFPFSIWGRLLLDRVRPGGEDLFGYHYIAGHPGLRAAIAGYLGASRGVNCDPEQIIVTTGAQAALDLLARLLLDPGDTVWMEEPGYLGAQSAFLAAGARLHPLHVGNDGWRLDDAIPAARLVYLTPSCQCPLGLTMRVEQRLKVLEIAQRIGAWVIEDDFDSEYRFGGKPIPAMQGTDATGRVIYVGTFAKTLFPSLRIGFMVMPAGLAPRVKQAINTTGQFAPLTLQATLAEFIQCGHFARHLRRMRRLYARRRGLFMHHCGAQLADWLTPLPGNAGIQTAWLLDGGWNDQALAEAAKLRQVNVAPLSVHYRHGAPRNGVILGYAALSESMMMAGLRELRDVLASRRPCDRPGTPAGATAPAGQNPYATRPSLPRSRLR